MAWQKNKILLTNVTTDEETGKKTFHRYVIRKSKGKGKPQDQNKKLTLKKYNPQTRKHEVYTESKYK